jgi:hypothetical protein
LKAAVTEEQPGAPDPSSLAWVEQVLQSALAALGKGDAAQAFHYLQALMARGHRGHQLQLLLATVAAQLGQYRKAMGYLAQAESEHQAEAACAPMPACRLLVIAPWGCGFWGEVDHVVVQLVFAEVMNREPIVNWTAPFSFPDPDAANAWPRYFQPVSTVRLEDVPKIAVSFFPPKWNAGNVTQAYNSRYSGVYGVFSTLRSLTSGAEAVVADSYSRLLDVLPWIPAGHRLDGMSATAVYREMFRKYIRPSDRLAAEVESIRARHLSVGPAIAVHYRTPNTDKLKESIEGRPIEFDAYFAEVDAQLARRPEARVFLLTDFAPAVDAFARRFGRRLVCQSAIRLERASDDWPKLDPARHGARLGWEVAVDVFTAATCDAFIGDGASGVSCAVMHLRDWPAGSAVLLRKPVFLAQGRLEWPLLT